MKEAWFVKKDKLFQNEEASWKRMLFSQPPVDDSFQVTYLREAEKDILSGSRYFIVDVIDRLDDEMHDRGEICGDFRIRLCESAHLRFGKRIEYCDELDELVEHEKREKEYEPNDDVITN